MLSLILSTILLLPTALTATIHARQSQEYYLVTSVLDQSYGSSSSKDGLYVSSYHTGAGESDATLDSDVSVAAKGYLNGTYQIFDFNTTFPWGLYMGSDANYAGWEFTQINVGNGTEGFFINETGLQWGTEDSGFGGWLACDWWHGLPQLFWLDSFYDDPIPSSCSQVYLLPQDIGA